MFNHSKHTRNYRDDILYLMAMRDSHLTHLQKDVAQYYFQPSFARLFCVFMIGEIEATFENWKEKDKKNILKPYFSHAKNISNEIRINSLFLSFEENGISVDRDILDKYLAIKHIRNMIVHSGELSEDKKIFVLAKGFPVSPKDLLDKHLAIMYEVNKTMIKYISSVEEDPFDEIKYDRYLMQINVPQIQKYYTKSEFMGFLWSNLEKMDFELKQSNDNKIIDNNFLKSLIFSWSTYKENVLIGYVDFENLSLNIECLMKILDDTKLKDFPSYLTPETELEIVRKIGNRYGIKEQDVVRYSLALYQAEVCYERIRNGSVSSLLSNVKKVRDSFNEFDFNLESEVATQLFDMLKLHSQFKNWHLS